MAPRLRHDGGPAPLLSPVVTPNPGETIARGRLGRESADATDDYLFLLECGLPLPVLRSALNAAEAWGVPLPDALLATGGMTETEYAERIAQTLSLPLAPDRVEIVPRQPVSRLGRHELHRLALADAARPVVALVATAGPPSLLRAEAQRLEEGLGISVVIATERAVNDAIERSFRKTAQRRATFGLLRAYPEFSAAMPSRMWQLLTVAVLAGLCLGGWLMAPGATVAILLVALTIPFAGVALVRVFALIEVLQPPPPKSATAIADADLPTYSVLVPLYDEVDVLRPLIAGLAALDYPAAKLDLVLVLESVDLATQAALLNLEFPANMRLVVVPEGMPQTKPKALNYALQFTRGSFVVVYDAEDRPEPDQLRKAVAVFKSGPAHLACVQARLNLYNPTVSWFSRQFTIEYSALFDAILPALDRLKLPVPLGGTSNHFPRAVLDAIGGWDPFNVTEDADLGIRLARLGYVTQILDSTTWEEAPTTWKQWKPQRTRWLKGWYQTYLVHTRSLPKLHRELGLRQSLGFHLFLGGMILSTLVHPIFYVLLAWTIFAGESLAIPDLFGGSWLWVLAALNLLLGYVSAIAVGVIAARRRGHGLAWSAVLMPLCWLLVSYAAYRALWQLWRDPFLWEKTAHGQMTDQPAPDLRQKNKAKNSKPRDSRFGAS